MKNNNMNKTAFVPAELEICVLNPDDVIATSQMSVETSLPEDQWPEVGFSELL